MFLSFFISSSSCSCSCSCSSSSSSSSSSSLSLLYLAEEIAIFYGKQREVMEGKADTCFTWMNIQH